MKAILNNPYIILALRLGFGAMFLVAAWDKVLEPDQFVISVDNYHMVPRIFLNLFALVLPWMELVVGLFLILGIMTEAAGLISAVLMLVFMVGLTQALIRGLDISCGCFSQTTGQESKISPLLLVRDLALLLGSLWIAYFNHGRLSVLQWVRSDRSPHGSASA